MPKQNSLKNLQQPDSFQKLGPEAESWIQSHQASIAGGIALLLVGGAGAAVTHYARQRKEDRASVELAKMLSDSSAKTPREKDLQTVKNAGELRVKYLNTQAGAVAALTVGEAQLRLGQGDQALQAFNDYLIVASKSDPFRAVALEGRGYAYESKRDLDGALSAFDRLAKENSTEFLAGMGLYHRARILIEKGNQPEAEKALSEVSTAFPGTAAAKMSADRLSLLKIADAGRP